MLLRNLSLVNEDQKVDILIEGEKIKNVSTGIPAPIPSLEFEDALVFPGLINSHDHLDFNLFPKLGNRVYSNYVEWGEDIHKQNKDTIDKVLKVPRGFRVQWGIYKNLLNGITTVVNHGEYLNTRSDLLDIWQDCHVLHSVQLEKNWRLKLNRPIIQKQPFAIHVGEGTDDASSREIDQLLKWNLLKRELIGIHGIAMNEGQAKGLKALVWCPDSNYFLIGKTTQIDKLKGNTTILFGTDSMVSSNWNLWDHLRLARQQTMVSGQELFEMLTTSPAKTWPMPNKGSLNKGYSADIVVTKKKSQNNLEAFYDVNPEDILIVIHRGNIRLFDESLKSQLSKAGIDQRGFSKVEVNSSLKYVFGDLPALIKAIKNYYPEAELPVSIA